MTMAAEYRAARFADVREMARLCGEAAQASRYSAFAGLDERAVKQALAESVQRQEEKYPRPGAFFIFVAAKENSLEGLIVATCQPLYYALDVLMVTDLIWYASPAASAATGMRLLRGMHDWAARYSGPLVIRQGVTDAIGNPDRTAQALEAQGFRRTGYLYEKEVMV